MFYVSDVVCAQSLSRPMTEAQFINNLRGVDDGRDFPRWFLQMLYASIQASPIEWQASKVYKRNHLLESLSLH